MKLEGSLDAFSLPDMFQLLSFTKKTGGLHLVSSEADGVVYFATGQITGASADGSRQPLARRLIGSGAVTDEALAAAVEATAAGEGLGIVRALLQAEALDASLLRQAATDQAVDAVFDLLRWSAGDFAFVVDEANPDDVGVALSVETVVKDAEARRATWDAVSKVVPSSRTVLAMPVVLTAEPEVTRGEWALLSLVDGRRTVSDLVDLTGSGQYAVVSTLAALVQRGLLEVRGESGDAGDADHVAVVLRRQQLLAPLETFAPAQPAQTASSSPAAARGGSAATGTGKTPGARTGGSPDRELVGASMAHRQPMLGGAHVPGDVVPPRPEPYLPQRRAEYDEPEHGGSGPVAGPALATATDGPTYIERDPSVNRSLMLRLIAGVRGL